MHNEESSRLQKIFEITQKKNQIYEKNIRKLLEQHKKLLSLTAQLIQVLDAENPSMQKRASLIRQIRLFKQNTSVLTGVLYE